MTVGNVKLALSEKMTLDCKLYLRDDKNAAFVELHHPLPWQAGMEHITLRAHKPQAVSDWLHPLSLGTMSASAYIENSA